MATLMAEFEQQFATVTADITSKICLIPSKEEGERRRLAVEIDKLMEEAKELLERMDLEARDAEPSIRDRLRAHIRGYQVELTRLLGENQRVCAAALNTNSSATDDVFGTGSGLSGLDEQRQALLDNTESLERTSARLTEGHRIALETEQIGAQILNDLHSQRHTLTHARSRLREADGDLDQSSHVLSVMLRRTLQNRFVVVVAVAAVLAVIIIALYVEFTRH